MARINIEITDAPGPASGATVVQQAAAPPASVAVAGPTLEAAARAAATGAINAGPAPTPGGMQTSSAPAPFVVSSASEVAHAEAESAGAAPAHLFGR